MTRDLGRLADTTFDVLVVGAGIYGATIACDAARRGFSVALIDKGDFGGATSANSLKTVHGGLRSLQRGALAEVRLFVRERRTLLRIAPHLVAPLTFVVPTSRHPVRNTAVMRIALALNDLVARDRNQGLLPSRRLHGGRLLARDEVIRLAPELDPAGLTGGASWCDAQMLNSERLVLAFVQSAAEAGAVTCNHVAADRLLRDGPRAVGAAARDVLTGHAFDVRARVTINAAGAWAAGLSSEVTRRPEAALLPSVSRALNVVTPRAASGPAIGGLSDGRFFFKVPWRGLAMYGTSHDPFNAGPDEARPPAEAVSALLADVNRAFPGAPVSLDEVSLVHWGLLPSAPSTGAHVQLAKRSVIRDHRADGAEGLVTVIGVRYTTARQTAQDAVDLAARLLGTSTAPGRDEAVLVGGDFDDPGELHRRVKAAVAGASDTDAQRLGRNYGSRVREILRLVARTPDLTAPLSSRCPVWRAEVRLAAEAELALTLTDALVRRTEAGSAGHPGLDAARAAAEEMAQVHAWDAPRMAREIDALDAHYRLQPSPHRA